MKAPPAKGLCSKHAMVLAVLLLAHFLQPQAKAQVVTSFAIYDIPASARTAGLGMDFLSVAGNDIDVSLDNPSLIHDGLQHHINFNLVGLFGGTKAGNAAYAFKTKHVGDFVAGLRFFSFGTFEGYDEVGSPTHDFRANDIMFSLGWCLHIDSNFSLGVTAKPVFSFYDNYFSFAFAMDVASSYASPSRRFCATIVGRNIGAQLATYAGETEHLPFHLDAGISYKLEEAPFRFYLQAADLQRWNLAYYDTLSPTSHFDPYTGETSHQSGIARFADNFFRHLTAGVELGVANKFFARLGYSYRQTKEMAAESRTSINFSGFSFGAGFHARRFDLSYARNNYHLGQAPNYITLNFHF
ncbi:MAG: type IX secretion system protein PorQ [Bacteroidales bacterium]|nr:type IX secretion system protein PorQ [Bacteroidales bacterium]